MKNTEVMETQYVLAIPARELARLLGVSIRQIWRLNSSARLPKPFRLGGSVRWLRKEIEAFVEAGCPDRKTWEAMTGGDDQC